MESTNIGHLEQEEEEDLNPCTIQREKVLETLVTPAEIIEETLQETATGTGTEMTDIQTDSQIEVQAEKEGEEMELSEPKDLIMGSQVDPEGIARRPNVWWGLL